MSNNKLIFDFWEKRQATSKLKDSPHGSCSTTLRLLFFLLFGHLSSHSSFFPHHHFSMFELFLIRKTLWERERERKKTSTNKDRCFFTSSSSNDDGQQWSNNKDYYYCCWCCRCQGVRIIISIFVSWRKIQIQKTYLVFLLLLLLLLCQYQSWLQNDDDEKFSSWILFFCVERAKEISKVWNWSLDSQWKNFEGLYTTPLNEKQN